VETLPIETYVARVLAGEAARDSQPAALEALAIAIRTFAMANRSRHRADGFDLCDQTHCQVLRTAIAATTRASQATAGRLLVRNGAPAQVFFSASCGGRTERPSDVWPGAEDPPYLPIQDDAACGGAPAWSASVAEADLQRSLRRAGYEGTLREMRIASRNASGRVQTLRLEGLKPSQISGQDLRVAVGRTMGWQHIKSTAFDLRRAAGTYHFSGHGSGHGVGLCVIGSAKLAEQGQSAEQILARYFPGLELSSGSAVATMTRAAPRVEPPVAVALPDGDEGERDSIVKDALTARDELARALDIPAPSTIVVRFHTTTDDYEKATGQAWYTSGAVVGGELHLVPISALRERGVLEQTIRRQIVHLLADGTLANRPAWVRDGAALYFSDPTAQVSSQRASCPTDAELQSPVSAGALATAYARARACFARQVASGRRWREVR
jgi:stage II sporulation protein D